MMAKGRERFIFVVSQNPSKRGPKGKIP